MKIADLHQRNPSVDVDKLEDLRALFEGGSKFRSRLYKFLPQNQVEPASSYAQRQREAHYRNYFAAKLLTAPLLVNLEAEGDEGPPEPPDFYAKLKEDCDGRGLDLSSFLRIAVTDALVEQRAVWLVQHPSPGVAVDTLAEYEAAKLGELRLRRVPILALLDWECDEDGALLWCIIYNASSRRASPYSGRPLVEHRWTIYTRETVETWLAVTKKGEPLKLEDDAALESPPTPHGFQQVPLVCLDVGSALWAGQMLEEPQLEHFRISNAANWAMRRACYPMLVFKGAEDGGPKATGAGYSQRIGSEESLEWLTPDAAPFAVMQDEASKQKDELYRVVHQMSLGIENNAASVGRSAGSKAADAAVTSVVLSAIGAVVRDAVEATYQLLSQGRGEDLTWNVEGLNVFDETEPQELAEVLGLVQTVGIPSPTFQREVKTRLALALLPDASQKVKDQVRNEIRENTPDEPEALTPLTPREEHEARVEAEAEAKAGGGGESDDTERNQE